MDMKISRLLLRLLLSLAFLPHANSEEVKAVGDKASLFTSRREVLTEATLAKLAPEAAVKVTRKSGNLTSYEVRWPEALLILNVDEKYGQTTQNEGMLGWLDKFPKEEMENKALAKLRAFVPSIARTYGIVLPEGFDGSGKCSSFLLKLSRDLDGYAFTDNGFYDPSGFLVVGLPASSPFFGRVGRNLITLDGTVSPKELLTGKWTATVTETNEMDDAELGMVIASVDEFLPDGAFLSNGTATCTVSSGEANPMARMGFNFTSKAKWIIKEGGVVVEGEKMKTGKPWCNPPAFKAMLDGIMEALTAESDDEPESHWIICREKDFVLLQEKETGMTVSMKRQKN